MPSVATSAPAQRYGSAAQVASYAGLSIKTVRRLVAAGKVRGRKVGRRLLIPFEDLDRLILPIDDHRRPAMPSASPTVPPRSAVDARGRLLPLSDEQLRERASDVARGLAQLDDMGDADEQGRTLDALIAALDEDRLSDRKRSC